MPLVEDGFTDTRAGSDGNSFSTTVVHLVYALSVSSSMPRDVNHGKISQGPSGIFYEDLFVI
jgi:hypothetical protein